MSEDEITLKDVERLRLEPGDTLALYVPADLSGDQLTRLRDVMRENFPDHRTVVLAGDMQLQVVEPPEHDDAR